MKGDFSRVSFDPRHHFSQVLQQQGRVTLDADSNEQGAILLHYLRTMARDLFGPYGAPAGNAGFGLQIVQGQDGPSLLIGAGRCYVQGVLCESEGCDYNQQPHFVPAPAGEAVDTGDPLRRWLQSRTRGDNRFWIYLDVWERHITALEMPPLREVALGGPDTCSRVQVIWQVRALPLDVIQERMQALRERLSQRLAATQDPQERVRLQARVDALQAGITRLQQGLLAQSCAEPLQLFERDPLPRLAAGIDPGERLDDPCTTSPDSSYRGAENHLYRVEIHRGNQDGGQASFKWSRDNGSVVTAWLSAAGGRLEVADTRGFAAGQWVEATDDRLDLASTPGPLFRIASVESECLLVDGAPVWDTEAVRPKLRLWNQTALGDAPLLDGVVPLVEGSTSEPHWFALEDGIRVYFEPGGEYHSGDYWLIPARVATGDIQWPDDSAGNPQLLAPRGVEHHQAPLGFVGRSVNGQDVGVLQPCACLVYPLSTCGVLGQRGQAAPELRDGVPANGIVPLVVERPVTPVAPPAGVSKKPRKRKPPSK